MLDARTAMNNVSAVTKELAVATMDLEKAERVISAGKLAAQEMGVIDIII